MKKGRTAFVEIGSAIQCGKKNMTMQTRYLKKFLPSDWLTNDFTWLKYPGKGCVKSTARKLHALL